MVSEDQRDRATTTRAARRAGTVSDGERVRHAVSVMEVDGALAFGSCCDEIGEAGQQRRFGVEST